jgi:hypothetical protein
MAGGQRMDYHGSWAGEKGKNSVFPDGPHKVKPYGSEEGAGEVMTYEDTNERIQYSQGMADRQTKKHPLKPGTRY